MKRFLTGLLFASLLCQCVYVAWNTGQTTDETFFSAVGYPIVRYNNYDFIGEHPPLMTQLGALPLLLFQPKYPINEPLYVPGMDKIDIGGTGTKFLYKMGNDAYQILRTERLPIAGVTLILAFFLLCWALELYGWGGALLSLSLLCFDPNIVVHGSLYTTDMGATAFFFLAMYRIKKLTESFNLKNALLAGIVCGLALLSKISTVLLIPITFFLFVLLAIFKPTPSQLSLKKQAWDPWLALLSVGLFILCLGQKIMVATVGPICLVALAPVEQLPLAQRWRKAVSAIYLVGWGIVFVCAILVFKKQALISMAAILWIFLGGGLTVFLSRRPEREKALTLTKWFCFIWLVAAVVIILGYTDFYAALIRFNPYKHFIKNFLWSYFHSVSGHGNCVKGSFVTCDWKYFASTMLLKTPSITLLLFLSGLVYLFRAKINRWDKILLTLPPAVYFFVASFLNHIRIGVRHVLPLYPFIFLISGMNAKAVSSIKNKNLRKALSLGLIVLVLLSNAAILRSFPDYISYFNAWVGGPARGAHFVAGSDVNWSQDNKRFAFYILKNKIPLIRIGHSSMNEAEYNYYKIPWVSMKESDYDHPQPGFYALDLSSYFSEQQRPDSWFKEKSPSARVGKTIYIFEVR